MADPTGSPPLLIGIDVGGTKIAGAVIEAPREHTFTDVRVLTQSSRPARRGPDALTDDVAALVNTLVAQLPPGSGTVAAIGIGTPGAVDETTGDVNDIANLAIGHVPLASAIRARCGMPVTVENDVNAAAVGAARLVEDGRAAGETIAFLNLGTGLAAGIIRDGELDRGSSNTVGEIAHPGRTAPLAVRLRAGRLPGDRGERRRGHTAVAIRLATDAGDPRSGAEHRPSAPQAGCGGA